MTTIKITIPDTVINRVRKGFCSRMGYAKTLEDGTNNPETKAQFMNRKILEFIMQAVQGDEIEIARNQAADAVITSIKEINLIVEDQ